MFKVKSVKFSTKMRPGDGLLAYVDDTLCIFYSQGVIINNKYAVGNLRFIKNQTGERELTSLSQHNDFPKEAFGKYKQISGMGNLYKFELNGFLPARQMVSLDSIICTLSGENTFRHHCNKYKFARKLYENFPETTFSEIGSSNVGLATPTSDIDIFILNNSDAVINMLRENFADFGLNINEKLYRADVQNHRVQYGFSKAEAEGICTQKLAGLELDKHKITFYDNSTNSSFMWLFKPNCSEQIALNGKVIDDKFAMHHTVCYKIASSAETHSVFLLRGEFLKEKRCILKKGNKVNVRGIRIHKKPNIIIAKDLNHVR